MYVKADLRPDPAYVAPKVPVKSNQKCEIATITEYHDENCTKAKQDLP